MPEKFDVRVWSQVAVNGDGVTLTVHGQVAFLHTGDLETGVRIDELWFGRRTPGYPVEMTRSQLLALRGMIDEALEVVVDENDMTWTAEGGPGGQADPGQ